MSLLNLIADKSTSAALANNRALPKFTTTTFAQTGSSIAKIADNAYNAAKNAISGTGASDATFSKPVTDMRDAAIAADPNNAAAYTSAANSSLSDMNTNAANALPNYNNSLYDIQNASRETMGGAVSDYSQSVEKINPGISSQVNEVGVSSLSEAGRVSDNAATSSYNAANNSVNSSVADIHESLADQAAADAATAKADTASSTVQELPDSTSTTTTSGDGLGTTTVTATSNYTSTEVDEGEAADRSANTIDLIYQDIKVYIEGVQVPFEAGSISQAIGQLPTASIQIPPQAGLMDICRYYQPKIHIFYTDANLGGDRLLFWGHIVACNYARSQQAGTATISFECLHKNALVQQLTFEWSAGGSANVTNGGSQTDINPNQAGVQLNNFNSEASIIKALQGVTGLQSDAKDLISPTNKEVIQADPTKLAARFKKFEQRMIGMPSAVMNMWNQVKLEVYSKESLNVIFSKMYVPLIEDGVRFFDRLSGHYILENQIQTSRVEHCNDHSRPELSKYKTMLPPAYRMDIQSAVQTKMAVSSLKSVLGFSGELTSFLDLFMNFYYGVEYEMLTLASPAEVPVDPTVVIDPDDLSTWIKQEKTAIETIIKPQLPFYYSPVCNVILPTMFSSLSVNQNESDIPTRVTAIGTAPAQAADNPNLLGVNYRAPQSIREAIALGRQYLTNGVAGRKNEAITLRETTGSSFNLPGRYELGRGIRHKKIAMPNWLSHFASDENDNRASKADEQLPQANSLEYKNLLNLHLAWVDQYGYKPVEDTDTGETNRVRDKTLDALNPYSTKADIMAYERLLFSSADYEYTKDVVRSKNGQVECLFNPYIIPGYPMDIIDPSPNHDSIHAMCASVTHSFTARSLGTNVGFLAAITYTELSNYYIQPTHPWLRNALCMINVERSDTLTEGGDTEADAADISQPTDSVTANNTEEGKSEERMFRREQEAKQKAAAQKQEQSTAYGLPTDEAYDTNKGDVKNVYQSLINNPRAKAVADQFYRSVLGVGAADPGQIYDFEYGGPLAVKRNYGIWLGDTMEQRPSANGGELNDNLTGVGGLRLVSRPIEGRKSIEAKFDVKFIDMIPQNYTATAVTYENDVATNSELLEPGASMFLDYPEVTSIMTDIDTGASTGGT